MPEPVPEFTETHSVGEPSREAMYRAIIGPKHADFYLPRFTCRDAGGRFLSWNWPSFFCQPLWAVYRRLWGFTFGGMAILFVCRQLAEVIWMLIAGALELSLLGYVLGTFLPAIVVLPITAMIANGFYHRKAVHLIRKTAHITDPAARLAELKRRGGTAAEWVFVVLALGVVWWMVAAMMPPEREDKLGPDARNQLSIAVASTKREPHNGRLEIEQIRRASPDYSAEGA